MKRTLHLTVTISGPGLKGKDAGPLREWAHACLNCNPRHIRVEQIDSISLEPPPPQRRVEVPVQLRRAPDGEVILFFRNSNSRGGRWLECYAHVGQHSEASEAFRLSCAPLNPYRLPEDARALLREWNSQPPHEVVGVAVARLPRN